MEPVLDLITSYESRIATVEELMTTAYQATVTSDGSFNILDEERERLKTGLQKTLTKNCSLRRKDFNRLIERVLFDSNENRVAIQEEQSRVREKVKEYLDEQKQLSNYLRQQLVELAREKTAKGSLDAAIGNIRAMYENKGQQLFATLRDFQQRLKDFQREQEEINHNLQRLMDRGESLSLEDLRQLEASEACQDRKAGRELRREEVDRLLSHFRQQRQESSHQSRQ
jgi:predicted phage tail protein